MRCQALSNKHADKVESGSPTNTTARWVTDGRYNKMEKSETPMTRREE